MLHVDEYISQSVVIKMASKRASCIYCYIGHKDSNQPCLRIDDDDDDDDDGDDGDDDDDGDDGDGGDDDDDNSLSGHGRSSCS